MERKLIDLDTSELKFVDGRAGGVTFAGYGAVFGNVDKHGDIIMPGAFAETLKARPAPVKMYFNHNSGMPIGKYAVLAEDAKGLYVEGELTPNLSLAKDVEAGMRHGTIDGLSIGYRVPSGGSQKDGRVRRLSKLDLVEVSVVSSPANDQARVMLDSIKSNLDQIETITDLEEFLRDAGGFSKSAAMALISRVKVVLGEPGPTDEVKRAVDAMLADINGFRLNNPN